MSTTTQTAPSLERTFTAMASQVTVRILHPEASAEAALDAVTELFAEIERTCTRFDDSSDLMRANAAGRGWCEVSSTCLDILTEAYDAYRSTDGVFDPRTLESLARLGYDRSWEKVSKGLHELRTEGAPSRSTRRWRPNFDDARSRVKLGSRPVDLGGIAKGIAVRQSLQLLRGHGRSALVEAGGDLAVFGPGPQGPEWRVRVESPFGGVDPVAVLDVRDISVATSSIRRRQWTVDGRSVHHLIDPRTGSPAVSGLRSVTIVHPDAAQAEVWTKVAFLAGSTGIRALTDGRSLPAVWVDEAGRVGYSRAAAPLMGWKVSRVRE
jgi:thiamine biosynthesis lipoprotein